MITMPTRTKLPKPQRLDKKGLMRNLDLTSNEKKDLTDQIAKLEITHQINTASTNIPTGEKVTQMMVIRICLKGKDLNPDLLHAIDEQLPMYVIFTIEDDEHNERLVINFKEPLIIERNNRKFVIKRTFESNQDETIYFEGKNLDDVYANLVRNVAKDELVSTTGSINIAQAVDITMEIEKLTKHADRLKKKMYSEKSMQKQMEAKRERNRILEQIVELKGK